MAVPYARLMQRCLFVGVFSLNASPSVEQQSDRVLVSAQRSFVRRCLFAEVFDLDANPSVEQQSDRVLASAQRSFVRRCLFAGVFGLDGRAAAARPRPCLHPRKLYATVSVCWNPWHPCRPLGRAGVGPIPRTRSRWQYAVVSVCRGPWPRIQHIGQVCVGIPLRVEARRSTAAAITLSPIPCPRLAPSREAPRRPAATAGLPFIGQVAVLSWSRVRATKLCAAVSVCRSPWLDVSPSAEQQPDRGLVSVPQCRTKPRFRYSLPT